ncbi:MAG: ATP-dependent protease LonB [Firmicutes bacterium]|nr:ATP-dependent protease LonB [Bacillota bacterium]
MGVYFYKQLRKERQVQPTGSHRGGREMDKLMKLNAIRLSEPLAERVRPTRFEDIIGQEEGIRALKAILCGPNPQHVIIYGPPGIGKTCAARLVLEAAKHTPGTPFRADAPFIEMDATCVRFDERAIADPLLGSVHDPIYQGAGQLGVNGVPQPKPGAVTRAHGGVLFLDEIGELHPIQMNKLLKVLEDRKVRFESAYYNPEDHHVPRHIHEIFKNGMPADFRLVGATTRGPESLPPALRSRCMEIYFRALEPDEVGAIAGDAANRTGFQMELQEAAMIGRYASCGRDAVNIVQMAAGVAQLDNRREITCEDVEWVVESGHYAAKPEQNVNTASTVGRVHGLAVYGSHQGAVMDIEAVAMPGRGRVTVTGIVEEEEMGPDGHRVRRKSMARASAENVLTLLRGMGYPVDEYDLHINFPGGNPVDGPSAGVAMAAVACSALTGQRVDGRAALTGEVGVRGVVHPVGGVPSKIEAAKRAGLSRVLVPKANWLERFASMGIDVVAVETLEEVLSWMLTDETDAQTSAVRGSVRRLVAMGTEKP